MKVRTATSYLYMCHVYYFVVAMSKEKRSQLIDAKRIRHSPAASPTHGDTDDESVDETVTIAQVIVHLIYHWWCVCALGFIFGYFLLECIFCCLTRLESACWLLLVQSK